MSVTIIDEYNNTEDPEELIIKITKKITINSKATNLISVFQWIGLAEKILKRYSDFDEKLIINLKYNLATALIEKDDFNKAKKLLKDVIEFYSKQNKPDKKKISYYFRIMAMTLKSMGDYENARTNILKAMEMAKNNYNLEYAEILYRLGSIKEAEENFKKALEISTRKNGKMSISTAPILSSYGIFLLSIGKKDLAIENMNNAYSIFKDTLGEESLYTVRVSSNISNFLYTEKKYAEAFEKMKAAFSMIKKIKGDDNKETLVSKNNCARMLVMMKKYGEAIDYLKNPVVFTDNKEKMVLLAYDKTIMEAPEVFILKTGRSALRTLKVLERKNIPIIEHALFTRYILENCCQFEPIPQRYWPVAAILLRDIIW